VQLKLSREQNAGSVHVILALSDNGAPSLTRYRRAIVEVQP